MKRLFDLSGSINLGLNGDDNEWEALTVILKVYYVYYIKYIKCIIGIFALDRDTRTFDVFLL